MKYSELYRAYANYADISIAEAQRRFERIPDFVMACLEAGEDVYFPGLFRLYTKVEPPKKARDPRNGNVIDVPARLRVKCDVAKKLKNHFLEADFELNRDVEE